jgi:predicted secreted Zn-dependent protease
MLLVLPSLALAKNSVSESYKFYLVTPNSKDEILHSLNKKSPILENGKVFHGYAHSNINWKFKWKYTASKCWITSAKTELNTTYTLPKLVADLTDVSEIWDQWYPNLLLHEKGHHKLAVDVAKKVQHAIAKIPSQSTCKGLEKKANSIGHTLISELDKQNKAYDKRTNHGETQGASLFRYL